MGIREKMSFKSSSNFIKISKGELAENSELYDIVKYLERKSLQEQGFEVTATKKIAPLKQNYNADADNSYNNNNASNESSDLEQHPELPYTGGKAMDQPMLPENAIEAVPESLLSQEQKTKISEKRKKQQEKQRKELANRLQNKFKIGGPGPAPKQAPKYQPKINYKHTPPKLRPPGS